MGFLGGPVILWLCPAPPSGPELCPPPPPEGRRKASLPSAPDQSPGLRGPGLETPQHPEGPAHSRPVGPAPRGSLRRPTSSRPVLPLAPQRVPQLHPDGRASLRVPDHREPVHRPDQRLGPGQLLLPGHQPHGLLHQKRLQQVRSAQPGCRRSGSGDVEGRRELRGSQDTGKRRFPLEVVKSGLWSPGSGAWTPGSSGRRAPEPRPGPPGGTGIRKESALSCAEILSTGDPACSHLHLIFKIPLPRYQALRTQHQGSVPSRDLCAGRAAGHPGVLRLWEVSGGGGRGRPGHSLSEPLGGTGDPRERAGRV